jgi:hypothetical protein
MTSPEAASAFPLATEGRLLRPGAPLAAWQSQFRGGCLVCAVYFEADC